MTETRKRPDWTLWLNLPKLKVWQAVALSLDIDPDSMKPSGHGWMSGPDGALSFMPASFADDAQATEFDKRRRIAAAQLAGRENADRAEGALRPFLDLAAGLGWPIPDALRLPMAEVSEPLLALLRPGPVTEEPPPLDDYSALATREQLVAAYGRFTGMSMKWFDNVTDTPALLAARKVDGVGARGSTTQPMFCPWEVMVWLANTKRKKGRQFQSADKPWELLERHFPAAYAKHSRDDSREYGPG